MPIIMDMAMAMSIERPPIEAIAAGGELKNWYWLKTEAANHARMLGLSAAGGKFEIIDRIADHLDGKAPAQPRKAGPRYRGSRFDWHAAPLSRAVIVTPDYSNTQNVRRFFIAQIGRHFSFNIAFMAWMKANAGKTLGDAADEWQRAHALVKAGQKPDIPFHNQFNSYVRAFFEDNPEMSMDEARHFWKLKRSLPGPNRYERTDLDLRV